MTATADMRRRAYRTRIYKDDYFVVKHLTSFITSRLEQYVGHGTRVVDVGCGEQPLRPLIEQLGGAYVGLDVAQNAQGTVQVIASITDMPVPDAACDVIVCTEVLEHVSDTYTAFAELARTLRPGGHLIITIPFTYPLHEEPYDFVRLTPHQVRTCAARSGLDVSELATTGNELEVIATVVDNMWRRGIVGKPNFFQRRLLLFSRLIMNSVAVAGNAVMGRRLPRKYYLNIVCVLTKPALPTS